MDPDRTAAALRRISRGLSELADAIAAPPAVSALSEEERYRAALEEWAQRGGLTRAETSDLLRAHGFSPQAAGGWVRGGWLEVRDDGLRHLTARSLQWLDQQREKEAHDTGPGNE